MNDFFLYEQLCALEAVGKKYPAGQDYSVRVRAIADQLASQVYRVAVVGEFKRGKSSLINALLGSSILPTDILPMTAAINRVVYGEKERIVVRYKDGRSEERSVAELLDFGTKIDAKKEGVARTIREIQVYYPSVFCKNHIEVLDTPGLNDNEEMTAVTLSILGEVDAAIFVISALEPLSMTEQDLILTLIARPGIRHIVFVVTCIDAVSADPEQQDRVVDLIRTRISENALEAALGRFEDDPELADKARRILSAPDVTGVSSLLAMKGFVRDDEDLLDESRFPAFKNKLLAYLTAAQSADMRAKAVDAAAQAARELERWHQAAQAELSGEVERAEALLRVQTEYRDGGRARLTQLFQEMDLSLERRGISEAGLPRAAQVELRKPFIARLSRLRLEEATHENILQALNAGREAAEAAFNNAFRALKVGTQADMLKVESALDAARKQAGFSEPTLRAQMHQWREQTPFPAFRWTQDPVHNGPDLSQVEVMPQVSAAIQDSLEQLGRALNDHIASWRLILIRRVAADRADAGPIESTSQRLQALRQRLSALSVNYAQHRRQVEEIRSKLCSGA